jgi:hypothetical protein
MECSPIQTNPNKKIARIDSMAPMIKKGYEDVVVLTRLLGILMPPDGGSPEVLLIGMGVGVAQLPVKTPRVEANICARAS